MSKRLGGRTSALRAVLAGRGRRRAAQCSPPSGRYLACRASSTSAATHCPAARACFDRAAKIPCGSIPATRRPVRRLRAGGLSRHGPQRCWPAARAGSPLQERVRSLADSCRRRAFRKDRADPARGQAGRSCTRVPIEPSDLARDDEANGEGGEALVDARDIRAMLVADGQVAKAGEPRVLALRLSALPRATERTRLS